MLTKSFRLLAFIPVFLGTAFFACQSNTEVHFKQINQDSLPVQQYLIDNSHDTVLHTANGALVEIARGSFSDKETKLQIKEAYSLEQMILAGLTTQAGDQLLSSGGMIYVNTEDKKGQILKPLKVT